MKLGLIDSYIRKEHFSREEETPPVERRRLSHGDQTVQVLKATYIELVNRELQSSHLGTVSIPDQKNILYYILKGVNELISQQVKVICLPIGFAKNTPLLETIANTCEEKGILLITPAGNEGKGKVTYPGAYPNVLCVGAVDSLGEVTSFSGSLQNEKGHCIKPEILAEGEHVSLSFNNNRQVTKGTSIACAKVAGLVAALVEVNPDVTGQKLKKLLYESCTSSTRSRYGLINRKKAMDIVRRKTFIQIEKSEVLTQSPKRRWVDQQLRSQCKRALSLDRTVQGLVAWNTAEQFLDILKNAADEELVSYSNFEHFDVSHIEAKPIFFETLFNHPNLTWASAMDINYFNI